MSRAGINILINKHQLSAAIIFFTLDLILKYFYVSGNNAVINRGISFGVLISSNFIYLILISVIFIWLYREKMWLILAGGMANLVSRIVWGGVVDYWNFFGLFSNNLADWMIGVGLVVYVVNNIRTIGKLGKPDNWKAGKI